MIAGNHCAAGNRNRYNSDHPCLSYVDELRATVTPWSALEDISGTTVIDNHPA